MEQRCKKKNRSTTYNYYQLIQDSNLKIYKHVSKGNNKITEHRAIFRRERQNSSVNKHRAIFQRERQNSSVNKETKSANNRKTGKTLMVLTWDRHF